MSDILSFTTLSDEECEIIFSDYAASEFGYLLRNHSSILSMKEEEVPLQRYVLSVKETFMPIREICSYAELDYFLSIFDHNIASIDYHNLKKHRIKAGLISWNMNDQAFPSFVAEVTTKYPKVADNLESILLVNDAFSDRGDFWTLNKMLAKRCPGQELPDLDMREVTTKIKILEEIEAQNLDCIVIQEDEFCPPLERFRWGAKDYVDFQDLLEALQDGSAKELHEHLKKEWGLKHMNLEFFWHVLQGNQNEVFGDKTVAKRFRSIVERYNLHQECKVLENVARKDYSIVGLEYNQLLVEVFFKARTLLSFTPSLDTQENEELFFRYYAPPNSTQGKEKPIVSLEDLKRFCRATFQKDRDSFLRAAVIFENDFGFEPREVGFEIGQTRLTQAYFDKLQDRNLLEVYNWLRSNPSLLEPGSNQMTYRRALRLLPYAAHRDSLFQFKKLGINMQASREYEGAIAFIRSGKRRELLSNTDFCHLASWLSDNPIFSTQIVRTLGVIADTWQKQAQGSEGSTTFSECIKEGFVQVRKWIPDEGVSRDYTKLAVKVAFLSEDKLVKLGEKISALTRLTAKFSAKRLLEIAESIE